MLGLGLGLLSQCIRESIFRSLFCRWHYGQNDVSNLELSVLCKKGRCHVDVTARQNHAVEQWKAIIDPKNGWRGDMR